MTMKEAQFANNVQHVQIPRQLNWEILHRGDVLIYANIRRHCGTKRNDGTYEGFPSIALVAKESQCSTKRVGEAIPRLVASQLIIRVEKREGTSSKYILPLFKASEQQFWDRFTPEFLDNTLLSPQAKEYYMDIAQYLKVWENGTASCLFSNKELADKTGLSIRSIKRYNMELATAGILSQETQLTTTEFGTNKVAKIFDLSKLDQAVLYILKNHDDAIKVHEEEIQQLKVQQEELQNSQDKMLELLNKYGTTIDKFAIFLQQSDFQKFLKENTAIDTTYKM